MSAAAEPTPSGVPPKPVPVPDEASAGFWAAAAGHALAMQRCTNCGRYAYPPAVVCTGCLAPEPSFRWEPVSGRGRVASWTVIHQAFLPGFAPDVPYTVLEVELDEQEGLRLVARQAGEWDPTLGEPVEVVFDGVGDGLSVPRFARAGTAGPAGTGEAP